MSQKIWPRVALGEIVQVVGGGTPSTRNPEHFDGDIPWLRPKDLSGTHDRYVKRGERNLSQIGLDNSSAKLVPANSVLLSTRAPIGYVALSANPIATNQGFRNLIPHDSVIPEYLYYWLKLNTETLERHASGTTFRELSGAALKAISISLPPVKEQRRVASVLGALDHRIELNRRMCETLEQIARALFKSWFVDFDPVRAKVEGRWRAGETLPGLPAELYSLFPDRLVDSQLGPIPEGWNIGQVQDLCDRVENGGTPSRREKRFWHGPIPWFKTGELMDGPLIVSEEAITYEGLRSSSCKLWPAGAILIALYASPTVGRLGILTRPGTANQACTALIASATFGDQFLFYTLSFARQHFQSVAVGAAQQNINQQIVRLHNVLLPSPNIAQLFQRYVEPFLHNRVTLAQKSLGLSEIRDTLLSRLLTKGASKSQEPSSILREE